jgi:hypothetical protein
MVTGSAPVLGTALDLAPGVAGETFGPLVGHALRPSLCLPQARAGVPWTYEFCFNGEHVLTSKTRY